MTLSEFYYFIEQFIFHECDGVTGTQPVECPHCGVVLELEVRGGDEEYSFSCCKGGDVFEINWMAGKVFW